MTNSAHSAVVVQAEEVAGAALAADRRRWTTAATATTSCQSQCQAADKRGCDTAAPERAKQRMGNRIGKIEGRA